MIFTFILDSLVFSCSVSLLSFYYFLLTSIEVFFIIRVTYGLGGVCAVLIYTFLGTVEII